MKPSLQRVPEPDSKESIVWRHTSQVGPHASNRGKFPPAFPAWFMKLGKLLYWLFFGVFWVFFLKNQREQGQVDVLSLAFWQNEAGSLVIFLAIIVMGLGLGFVFKKLQIKSPEIDQASGIPVWMSTRRIVLIPSLTATANAVDINAIKSISTDFIMGSPALVVCTSTDIYRFISSETRSLLQNLYTLRPDLEPTS